MSAEKTTSEESGKGREEQKPAKGSMFTLLTDAPVVPIFLPLDPIEAKKTVQAYEDMGYVVSWHPNSAKAWVIEAQVIGEFS